MITAFDIVTDLICCSFVVVCLVSDSHIYSHCRVMLSFIYIGIVAISHIFLWTAFFFSWSAHHSVLAHVCGFSIVKFGFQSGPLELSSPLQVTHLPCVGFCTSGIDTR